MHQICAHVCAWKSPELLRVFIPRFLDSLTEDVNLKIVLNEADDESINLCRDYKVDFVAIDKNYGTLAVDFLIPFTNAEYVLQSNTDMYYPKNGWDTAMLKAIKANGNSSISLSLCEPWGHGNPVVITDNCGEFTDSKTCDVFRDNFKAGKYKLHNQVSYTHPILTSFKDLVAVGGYSDNMDMEFFPGYGIDNDFPYRLWKLYDKKFKFLTLGDWFVYHGISRTNEKLPSDIRARNGINRFIHKNGCHWTDFNREINIFSPIEIK